MVIELPLGMKLWWRLPNPVPRQRSYKRGPLSFLLPISKPEGNAHSYPVALKTSV